MRHGKKINHLGRTDSHRSAMLANMAVSLILHKKINTTLAKAKALRVYVEPMLTKSKEDTTHSRRQVFSDLQDKQAVAMLFRDVAAKIATRPGGYTRILKTGIRSGDNAEMALIELVDFNENYKTGKKEVAKAKSRRGGGKKKVVKAATAAPVEVSPEVAESEVPETEITPKATKKKSSTGDESEKKD